MNITIFLSIFAASNISEIKLKSAAGNLSPVHLNGQSGLQYQSAIETNWDKATTHIVNESLTESEIVANVSNAFTLLAKGEIEAITLSVNMFLLLQQRPEFNTN